MKIANIKKLNGVTSLVVAVIVIFTSMFSTNIASAGQIEYLRGIPERVTVDDRVAKSDFIFIGEPVRIYFADKDYKEVPYSESIVLYASPQSGVRFRRALVEIKVDKALWDVSAKARQYVLLPLPPTAKEAAFSDKSTYEEHVTKYIGNKGIWFGRISTIEEYYESRPDGSGAERIKLSEPVELFLPDYWIAKSHRVPNPTPLSHLEEVTESIRKVKTK
ncbi:MAG TPA: hypothetical protein VK642_04725 [Burkholderiales bacterium]|nr:hypothetical protein [Burkholderiales bacterium]